jgi:AraC-like DNA-binding protein
MASTAQRPPDLSIIGADSRESIVSEYACRALQRYGITLIGVSRVRSPYRQERLVAGHAEIQVCFAGQGVHETDGRRSILRKGEACVLPAGIHQHFYATSAEPWGLSWVHYRPDALRLPQRTVWQEPADPQPLRATVDMLFRETSGQADPGIQSLLVDLIHAWVLRLTSGSAVDPRLQTVMDQVHDRLAEAWNLERLAALARVTPEHLRRLFGQHFGLSPMAWLTRLRMQRAAGQLTSSRSKVEAVALEVGYSSVYSFSTAFKRVMGIRPTALRDRTASPARPPAKRARRSPKA